MVSLNSHVAVQTRRRPRAQHYTADKETLMASPSGTRHGTSFVAAFPASPRLPRAFQRPDRLSSAKPVRPAGLFALVEEAAELAPRDEGSQALERPFHAGTRLRGRHEELRPAALRDLLDVLLAELAVRLEVRLVHRDEDGHAHDDLPDRVDPARNAVEGAPAREVGDGQDAARSREVRFSQQLSEGLVAHDVPDRHVQLHLEVLLLDRDAQLLLRDLRAEGRLVPVVVLVEDVPPDQGGLPDGRVADEAHFRLHDHGPHGFRSPLGDVISTSPSSKLPFGYRISKDSKPGYQAETRSWTVSTGAGRAPLRPFR